MMPKSYMVNNQNLIKLKKMKSVKFLYSRCKEILQIELFFVYVVVCIFFHRHIAQFIYRQIIKQISLPFGIIKRFSNNKTYKSFCLYPSQMVNQNFHSFIPQCHLCIHNYSSLPFIKVNGFIISISFNLKLNNCLSVVIK